MIKKLLLAMSLLTFSAPTVYAQECVKTSDLKAQIVEMQTANPEMNIKFLVMEGAVMKNFMENFEASAGPAPVEYNSILLLFTDEIGQLVLINDGCKVLQTRPFPRRLINFFREANGA